MNKLCAKLHQQAGHYKRFRFPFKLSKIPPNGIYLLFQKGEKGHGVERIVRVGTHRGDGELPSRLIQHFEMENKDRSIFRKNIGRCFLHEAQRSYLPQWERDFTTKQVRRKPLTLLEKKFQAELEKKISKYIQGNFSFSFIEVPQAKDRLRLEAALISAVSSCGHCRPSKRWLGLFSPKEKIRQSGLWQVNELYKEDALKKRLIAQLLEANATRPY